MSLGDYNRSISATSRRIAAWYNPVRETNDSVARNAVVQQSRTGYIELKPSAIGTLASEAQPRLALTKDKETYRKERSGCHGYTISLRTLVELKW